MLDNFPTAHCHPMSLDSGSTPESFIEREVELGTGTITTTDHGSLAACKTIYDLARKKKLIPILGAEFYFRDDNCPILAADPRYTKNDKGAFVNAPKYSHLTCHFLDQEAYETGIKLLSAADLRLEETLEKLKSKDRKHGSERKPLFTWTDLEELGSKNVTLTSSCMIGIFKRHIFDNRDNIDNNGLKTAEAYLQRMISITKPGNFYIELNPHDTSKDWLEGIFITTVNGQKLQFYREKKLLTNVGEITAEELAKEWAKGEHKILKSVKDRNKWREGPELEIKVVEHIEDFLPNDPCQWAPNGDYESGLNRIAKIMAKKYNLPIIIGDDSHYSRIEEKTVQDVKLAQNGPWRFYGNYSRLSSQEAFEHFHKTLGTSEDEFKSWIENAKNWSQRFKDFTFNTPLSLPKKFYEVRYKENAWYKENQENNSLRYILELIKKHGRMDWKNKVYVDRLETEIKLFHKNGTIDLLPYFMVMEEVCDLYKKNNQLTGPTRGSAGGCILSYLLGITHIDPIKYKLSLERFLTLDRIASGALPDIDLDLPNRDLLIPWLNERFPEHWAQISVDSTIKLKSAVRDVCRAIRGLVNPDVEKLAKEFILPPVGVTDHDFVLGYTNDSEGAVQGSCEYDPALKEYIKNYPDDWEIVKKCLGLARQRGRHASAVLIADKPIHEFIPLTTVSGHRVTAYTAKPVESVGGIKFDFLTINVLNDLSAALSLIQKRSGLDIPKETKINGRAVPPYRLVPLNGQFHDIWDLPEDQDVFEDISLGKTETVFQLSTPGAQKWLAYFSEKKENGNYSIDSVEAISAFTALDRKGPLEVFVNNPDTGLPHNTLVEYSRRIRGCNPSTDILPIFDQLIPETNGILTYQESLQYLYQQLTGCTGTEAESFRRKIAKKLKQEIEKLYKDFIEKASLKIGEQNAKDVWEMCMAWSGYGFCKSHAVGYAVIAYACAYLKHYYPLEWWCAVLRNADKNEVNENFWSHAGHLIEPPDIKLSGKEYEIQGNKIRAPLNLLKGVGDGAQEQINKYAPYTDIDDFCRKIEQHKLETGETIEVLKTRKDTANKVLDPETGKKVSKEVSYMVKQLKKGHSAINRGVVHKLIISGAMDSIFPEDMHLGDQLIAFENALAKAANEIGERLHRESGEYKKYTAVKPQVVDPNEWDVGPIMRYQMRKQILPSYGMDLRPYLMIEHNGVLPDNKFEWFDFRGNCLNLPIINHKELIKLHNSDEVKTVVVGGYIEEMEFKRFTDKKDKSTKEMCKIIIDVEGSKFEFIKWPNKDRKVPEMFHQELKGAVVLMVLNRYKSGKNLNIEDLILLERPLKEIKD